MGERSAIEWTTHTFNPWWGCVRVSPGCEHCYAETFAKRTGHAIWGPAKTTGRRTFGEKHWAEPLRWNAAAEKAGERARVFCASMADVFEDHPALVAERAKLWPLIEATPWLDWQILTKRPENVRWMVPLVWWQDGLPANVWLGTSVEDQQRADQRIEELLGVRAEVRFLSCEPLLGPVDISPWAIHLDWVIIGGESGPGARPFHVQWARSLIAQCRAAGAAPFVKQLGARPRSSSEVFGIRKAKDVGGEWEHRLYDAKGGEPAEWPEDLRVREMPTPSTTKAEV